MSTERRLQNLNINPNAPVSVIERKLEEKLAELQKKMDEKETPEEQTNE